MIKQKNLLKILHPKVYRVSNLFTVEKLSLTVSNVKMEDLQVEIFVFVVFFHTNSKIFLNLIILLSISPGFRCFFCYQASSFRHL